MDKFDRILSSVIDSHLGLRSKLIGYQYSEITRAVEAINGEGKALDTKQKWAGVYRLLRWQCNFPVRGSEFCERINRLKC